MKVKCVNDSGRPNEIPLSKWIKKDNTYTVINAVKCNIQGGILGYELEEIDLKGCDPYLFFAAYRFIMNEPPAKIIEDELVEELMA